MADPKQKPWQKPGDKAALEPPQEKGKILAAILHRKGWAGDADTEVHLTYNRMEGGGDYGRAQVWRKNDQGQLWPVPKSGITVRRDEMTVWFEFLLQLQAEFASHPKPTKGGAH